MVPALLMPDLPLTGLALKDALVTPRPTTALGLDLGPESGGLFGSSRCGDDEAGIGRPEGIRAAIGKMERRC